MTDKVVRIKLLWKSINGPYRFDRERSIDLSRLDKNDTDIGSWSTPKQLDVNRYETISYIYI